MTTEIEITDGIDKVMLESMHESHLRKLNEGVVSGALDDVELCKLIIEYCDKYDEGKPMQSMDSLMEEEAKLFGIRKL